MFILGDEVNYIVTKEKKSWEPQTYIGTHFLFVFKIDFYQIHPHFFFINLFKNIYHDKIQMAPLESNYWLKL